MRHRSVKREFSTHKGVGAHDTSMDKDSGIGRGSTVTSSDVVSD